MARRPVVLAILCICVVGCASAAVDHNGSVDSSTSSSQERLPPTQEAFVAAAIDRFAIAFPGNVPFATTIVLPDSVDTQVVGTLITDHREWKTDSYGLDAYWIVLKVSDNGGFWQVDMASVNGSDYFGGSLFFTVSAGEIVSAKAEDVGATATTVVS